jgi:hypothetical protein
MTIPEKLIKQGAKATEESWRDNYQTPREILDRVDEFYTNKWVDPFPINPGDFDCFSQNFNGKPLYINPPFSQYAEAVEHLTGDGSIGPFVTRQLWLLENVKTETKYAQKLLRLASAICFINKRINFLDPRTGEPFKVWSEKKQKWENGSPRTAYLLIYIGDTPTHFKDVFESLGVVINKQDYWDKF